MKKFLLLLLIIACSQLSFAQHLSKESKISVITCDPGGEIYTVYGHNAIRIQDPLSGLDKVYNYGTFDFRESGFMQKFMRGKLKYFLGTTSFRNFMASYNYDERGVIESTLLLDSLQKQTLYQNLEINCLKENRYYLYDFFYDNCATRIRDIIETTFGKENITYPTAKPNTTLRNMLDQYTYKDQWLTFGQSLVVGAPSDIKTDVSMQMFIPEYLNNHFKNTTILVNGVRKNLIQEEHRLTQFEDNRSTTMITPVMVFVLFLLLELFLLLTSKTGRWVRIYDKMLYSILGLTSILIIVMWFFTDHLSTKNNWNLLWINPLFLILLFIKTKGKLWINTIYTILGLLILSLFYKFLPQAYYPGVIILIPSIILNLIRNGKKNILV